MSTTDEGEYDEFSDEESEFDLEDLELFAELIEQEDIDLGYNDMVEIQDFGREVQDFSNLDIANVFKVVDNVDYGINSFNEVEVKRIPKGIRKYKELQTLEFVSEKSYLECNDGIVFMNGIEVGVCKFDFPKLKVDRENVFDKADSYTEEVKGKGSGYGFSSYCHLMAVLSLSLNKGFLEPYEGCDYTLESDGRELTIEVTGLNYSKRLTSANMVLNKYPILMMCSKDERVLECIELSRKEEINDSSFLRYSAFMSKESPYTKNFDEIHSIIRLLTKAQISGIYDHVSKWLLSTNDEFKRVIEKRPGFEFVGGKDGKFPAPFKVRKMPHYDEMFRYEVVSNLWKDNSGKDWYDGKHNSYRTVDHNDDYIEMCTSKSEIVGRVNDSWSTVPEKCVDYLERIQAIQSARIQKELFDKIQGYKGFYYSEKDGVGIAWSQTGKESLNFNCVFYTKENPNNEKLFGKWVPEDAYHRSPGFKVSRQDINFVKKNYDATIATFISMISVSDFGEEFDEFISLFSVLTSNSSWKTSDYADNCRFTTTGHLSGNDISYLLVKPITQGKPIRSSEFLYMHLINRYLESPPPRNKTPLFRLDLKYMCLEKDLGLAVNWSNREADHETECCRKLIERTADEVRLQEQVVQFYSRVVSYMSKLISVGVEYEETSRLLNSTPEEPVLNPVFYIAMCYSCKEEIEAASSRQVQTGFSINDMVSDRGSIKLDRKKNCYSEAKVCDELRKLVSKLDIKGPYDGLLKLMKESGDKVYLIRSKNGRGRREFATQTIKSRYMQMFEEKLASGVSLSAPDDQFLNPHKYNEMVEGFTKVISSERPVVGSSEDRSFHCGHNMPEALSVASLIHAVVNSIPYYTTLSAIKRCNTHRLCILPKGFKKDVIDIPKELNPTRVSMLSRNKITVRHCVEVRKHAMQGMHAVISGVLNTTHVKGVENIMQRNAAMFEESHVFTTQDDVGRAVSLSDGVDPNWAQGNYLMKPMKTLNMTLQKNNERKHVVIEHDKSSYGILEVNNILMTGNGMISQSHIHPHHIIQPLTSDSIVIDMMDCVNNSRQSLFWGDSPTLAWTCLEMCLYTLRMKWTLTKGNINYFKEIKLLPSCVEELISGFFPRSEDAMKIFINCMTDGEIESFTKGRKSLYDNACNVYSKSCGKDDRKMVEIVKSSLRTFDDKCELVYSSRLRKGKLKSQFVKPMAIKKRIEIKDRFLNGFIAEPRSKEAIEKVMRFEPPKIYGQIRPLRLEDRKPCIFGEIVPEVGLSRKNLICNKLIGTNYRTLLTDEEKEELSNPDFWEDRSEDLRFSKEEGFEIHSPSGLPVIKFLGKHKFLKPMVYNFSLELVRPERGKRPFVYRGASVQDIKPCLYGRASIEGEDVLAFCTGILNGKRKAFYKKGLKGKLSCVDADDTTSRIVRVDVDKRTTVRYLNREDWSPIDANYIRHVPGVEGSPIAVLNYAGFLRSNNERGFHILKEKFLKSGSMMPHFMKQYMPDYPRFHKDHVEVNTTRLLLTGETMISKIKRVGGHTKVRHFTIIDEVKEHFIQRFVD